MTGKLNGSIFRITSSDLENPRYGTGFAIKQDGNISYILTCAHVVIDIGGEENIRIEDNPAQVIAIGSTDGIDLAVLKVEGLGKLPTFRLRVLGHRDMPFLTRGFGDFDKQQYAARSLRGVLGDEITLVSDTHEERIDAWDLKIENDTFSELKPGYSGSPVYDENTGIAFAVVSHGRGVKKGQAISIANLGLIWQEMPDIVSDSQDDELSTLIQDYEYAPLSPATYLK